MLQDRRLAAAAAEATRHAAVILAPAARAAALELLRAPDLLERIAGAFDAAGTVGEATNKLAAYLACTSRLMDKPLGVIIQSTSAAGNSTLMDAVLAFARRTGILPVMDDGLPACRFIGGHDGCTV